MDNSILKINFTEDEAIKITIEHGYEGSEFNTSVWKKRGCLKPNRTLEALISKLETIYHKVEVTGNGMKRRYILEDKKEETSERKLNYKGSVVTIEDELMKEFIFNRLLTLEDEFTLSYKGWSKWLGFFNTDSLSINVLLKTIKELHFGLPFIYNPNEIVSKFIQTINVRNKDVVSKSFNTLQREGRISFTEVYNFKTSTDEFVEVDETEYLAAQDYLIKYLQTKEVSYYAYSQSITNFNRSKKMQNIIQEVEEKLEENFSIKFFFKTFKVVVLNKTVLKEVTEEEFNKAYFNRLVKLTKDRQGKQEYNNSLSFWKRFYLLNTLTLLELINVDGLQELLKVEGLLKSKKVDDYSKDIKEKREKMRHTFGSI